MKVHGDKNPGIYTFEPQPNMPGYYMLRLFENVEQYTETRENQTTSGYRYDEYQLLLPYYSGLEDNIQIHLADYLRDAKAAEEAKRPVEEKLREVNQNLTDCILEMSQIIYG